MNISMLHELRACERLHGMLLASSWAHLLSHRLCHHLNSPGKKNKEGLDLNAIDLYYVIIAFIITDTDLCHCLICLSSVGI